MPRIFRNNISAAFSATEAALRHRSDEALQQAAYTARSAPLVELGSGPHRSYLGILLRVSDIFHTGPEPRGKVALRTAEHAGRIMLAEDLLFFDELPAYRDENFGFLAPVVPQSHGLRQQNNLRLLLQVTEDEANDRIFAAGLTECSEWAHEGRVFDPRVIAPTV